MITVSNRLCIDGIHIDRLTLVETMQKILDTCESDRALQIVTVNLNFLTLARNKPFFRKVINDAHIVVADGRFILWFSTLLGEPLEDQITGHDLVRECLKIGKDRAYRVFFLGGMAGVAENVCRKLRTQYPEIIFDGMSGGIFSETGECIENDKICAKVRDFKPHFLFVALGAPKQDVWISKNLDFLNARVAIGVGGVLDTLLGTLPRAPRWMQVLGLESLFQLLVEPRRYWRRYLLNDPITLFSVIIDIFRLRLSTKF